MVAASMVSKLQLAGEVKEVGDDLEKEINPFGSAVSPSDRVGLNPKTRADPRELAGND